ncbi:MAG: hypothetical protein VZQ83_07230 [Eubacterium sp.]|nr:hypothetical protein [Eubacterium sp.]
MRSKTSFFNKSLYLSDLKSQIPTIALLLFGYFSLLFVPGIMEYMRASQPDMIGDPLAVTAKYNVLMDITDWMTNPVLIGALSIMITVVLFHYQFSRRSSYMLHSFPIRRLAHFVSHALAGLTVMLILMLVTFVSMLFISGTEAWLSGFVMLRMVEALVEILFFHALSLLTVVVCGNMILSIVTFGVLNALWLFINMFASFMHTLLAHHPIASVRSQGFQFIIFEKTDFLFPVYFFTKCHNRLQPVMGSQEISYVGDFLHVLWMLIPAAALCVVAALLYKNKRLERTGETVAFGWCRVVFRVLFTVCGGGLVMGGVFVMMSNQIVIEVDENTGLIAFAIGLLIIGSVIGFFISEMLLQKNVHIFKGKKIPFIQGVIPLGVMLLYVMLLSVHIIGPAYKPDPDEVMLLEISGTDFAGGYTFSAELDGEMLRKIAQTHRELVDDPKLLELAKREQRGESGDFGCVQFRFINEDGSWIYLNYAYDNEEDRKRIFDSFIPDVTDGAHMMTSVIGKDAPTMLPDEISFTYFGNSEDRSKGYADQVGFGDYLWDKDAFIERSQPDGSILIDDDPDDGADVTTENISDLQKYDYLIKSAVKTLEKFPLKDDGPDSNVIMKYTDQTCLYQAILKDMSNGKILPYSLEDAEVFGDARVKDIICQLEISLHGGDNKMIEVDGVERETTNCYITVCVTSECTETIAQLEKAGAIVRKAGA